MEVTTPFISTAQISALQEADDEILQEELEAERQAKRLRTARR
jgi:hypothetical protein